MPKLADYDPRTAMSPEELTRFESLRDPLIAMTPDQASTWIDNNAGSILEIREILKRQAKIINALVAKLD